MAGPTDVRRLTNPPAIAMLVAAALSVLGSLISMGATLLEPMAGLRGFESRFKEAQLDPAIFVAISWVSLLTMLAIGLVAGFGALALLRRGSWVLGLTAAILLCIPCAWPLCCPFPAGIGIWAIIVLLREDVRTALGRTPNAGAAPPAFTVPPPPNDAGPDRPEPERERDDPGGWGS